MSQRSKVVRHILRSGIVPRDVLRHLVSAGVASATEVEEHYGKEPLPDTEEGRQEWSKELAGFLEDREIEFVEETRLDNERG